MLGRHNVVVQNAYIKYDFDIIRSITIIRGQSATGKTTLVETTLDSEMRYSKKKMNVYYFLDNNVGGIMKEIPDRLEV